MSDYYRATNLLAINSFQNNQRSLIIGILVITALFSGCLGLPFLHRSSDEGFMSADGRFCIPDNCSKCHQAWTERFEYYRGWDRYGYIFGEENISGFFDPWIRPDVTNTFETYYTTNWWESPELYVWPDNIETNAVSLSVLSRPGGLPIIPKSRNDITGPVITVAPEGGEYSSIRKAVNKAKSGTTVFVRSGEYNEVITLKDGVSLIGENPETTIINPLNEGHAVRAANNSMIAGFTLTGTGIDYESKQFNCAVYVSGCDSTCVIANNIFRENGLFGVWIDGTMDTKANYQMDKEFGTRRIEVEDRPYTDYPNPIITGNTFYRIGQRGVFCVHARGEVFNNIFAGNVKAIGLERHSRPFIHHNVFYFNNVPMAVNRSEPLVCNNIFLQNQWGQRMLRGANPVIFNNVNFNSPFFRDFDEAGIPIHYTTNPGVGERDLEPGFVDPLKGNFSFSTSSPLRNETTGFGAVGIMRDSGLPQPHQIQCANSWGREVLSMNEDIVKLIETIECENAKIRRIDASYRISYKDFSDITVNASGDPVRTNITDPENPVATVEYNVPRWTMEGQEREKEYIERTTVNGSINEDSGTISFNGNNLHASEGRFVKYYKGNPDQLFIGERPFREAPGGFYRDYDQFVYGSIGSTGTFITGYLRIMGGIILEDKENIDNHECIVVRYPHIGKDQYFLYYLDPAIGYRPRKIEQYYNESPYRIKDSYRYREYADGIHLPVHVCVTDYAVTGGDIGKKAAFWELTVDEQDVRVNGRR